MHVFHGGKKPDGADFRAFAVLKRVGFTSAMKQIFDDREDKRVEYWMKDMELLCCQR